jgi:hypothetical protein
METESLETMDRLKRQLSSALQRLRQQQKDKDMDTDSRGVSAPAPGPVPTSAQGDGAGAGAGAGVGGQADKAVRERELPLRPTLGLWRSASL